MMCALGMTHSESFARGQMSSVASTSIYLDFTSNLFKPASLFPLFFNICARFTSEYRKDLPKSLNIEK